MASAPALVRNPYDRNWEKLRAAFLARNPLCLFCLQAGHVTPAAEVDRISALERQFIELRAELNSVTQASRVRLPGK